MGSIDLSKDLVMGAVHAALVKESAGLLADFDISGIAAILPDGVAEFSKVRVSLNPKPKPAPLPSTRKTKTGSTLRLAAFEGEQV